MDLHAMHAHVDGVDYEFSSSFAMNGELCSVCHGYVDVIQSSSYKRNRTGKKDEKI
ncbi:hypothetical protein DM01DRAFT_1338522 [Hesseltinella vesiculosa]|uniref:Uncharacterized protein n=1 Tax=Hesseltinella vesiculosa TaxID=101127 RepID=A0A1X2G9D9_9FUNG|nr:hypothetical protein DM01DRAFT_1338522 [Hesseltinella vesiculosa]